jgi:S1-C subfamily serine protease
MTKTTPPLDPLLLATARVTTFAGTAGLTSATGFFFRRGERLYLVSSRHVFFDEAAGHRPDRMEIELHTDAHNVAKTVGLSMLLYQGGRANWVQGGDSAGDVDVAVLKLHRDALPADITLAAFTPENLPGDDEPIPIGHPVLIPGFPLGFHDQVLHLPVVRQGTVASPFGWRFQGAGCFLTDARTHRGISGAPVVVSAPGRRPVPWLLLGIHSSRLDMGNRDLNSDESLGLNSAWYADILMTLTEPQAAP